MQHFPDKEQGWWQNQEDTTGFPSQTVIDPSAQPPPTVRNRPLGVPFVYPY